MTLQLLGAAQTVISPMHLLTVNRSCVLFACGMFQGKRGEAFERNKNLPFDVSDIGAVLLSHAHIDHAGNLPNLVCSGFRGPMYATSATLNLSSVVPFDSANLQERDVEFVEKQQKKNEPPVESPYSPEDIERTVGQMVGVLYGQFFETAEGTVSFSDAGLVLGSAVTRVETKEAGKTKLIGFSRDLGHKNTRSLEAFKTRPECLDKERLQYFGDAKKIVKSEGVTS